MAFSIFVKQSRLLADCQHHEQHFGGEIAGMSDRDRQTDEISRLEQDERTMSPIVRNPQTRLKYFDDSS
jgi:hypothetical protein